MGDTGDSTEEFIKTRISSQEYNQSYHVKLGKSNTLTNRETSEMVNSISKLNTIIIRCSDDNIPTSHVRMCTTCLKKIDPHYYFLWEFMEFCNVLCISKFQGLNFKCMYCSRFINNTLFGKFYIRTQKMLRFFCSIPCMNHYRLTVKCCLFCQRDISGGVNSAFCSDVCYGGFNAIVKPPRVPPKTICCVCQQEKPVEIVLKHDGIKYFCAKRCSIAYSFVKLKADIEPCMMCQYYFSQTILRKFTVYYGNVTLVFCSASCQNVYMSLNGKIVSCTWCHNERYNFGMIRKFSNASSRNMYICSVNCFKLYECSIFAGVSTTTALPTVGIQCSELENQNQSKNKDGNNLSFVEAQHFLVHTKTPAVQRNVATMCFIPKANKDVIAKPDVSDKETQTDKTKLRDIILPTPVPIYVPTPMAMYSIPVPTAVPFPLPVPVPVFIPVAKRSINNIMNKIETMHSRIPRDPCEAELLKIADIIAEEKQKTPTEVSFEDKETSLNVKTDWSTKLLSNSNVKQLGNNTDILTRKRSFDNLDSYETKKRKSGDLFKPIKKISINYTLGMAALQRWVQNKHDSIFNMNILQMMPDELNLVLCSFVKELKKPDGSEYAPDTLYYLCLGIQYSLIENGRSDNIFGDKPYDEFCEILHTFAEKFNLLYREGSHFIVTRVEEQHLWDTEQLGYHSPLVLLNTLVYFNAKYYHCSTLQQHLDISFLQILKLWSKKSKSKSMMLRFHPKQVAGRKQVYEQYTNETDQTRCPVKIYEFYLSKCPESVKSSTSLFYLQPEQYCTSDSPLWYTNSSLAEDSLVKMLNRVKMVKEINIAVFTSN